MASYLPQVQVSGWPEGQEVGPEQAGVSSGGIHTGWGESRQFIGPSVPHSSSQNQARTEMEKVTWTDPQRQKGAA